MMERNVIVRVENLGFYRELPHGDPQGPSLRELLGKGDVEARDGVANYLTTGSILATTGEYVFDVLKDGNLGMRIRVIEVSPAGSIPAKTFEVKGHEWTRAFTAEAR